MKNALMLVAALALMAPVAHAATSIPAGKTVAQADQAPTPHKKKHKKKKGAQAPAGETQKQ